MAQKIKIEPLPEATAAYQERGTQKAIAEVKLKAKGKVYTKRQEGMKGDPEQPLTKTELEIKFRSLASRVVTKNRTEKLIEIINSFEELDDLKPLTRLFKASTIANVLNKVI